MRTFMLAAALVLVGSARVHAQATGDTTDVRGLPIVEMPSRSPGNTLAILLSGDGGWASIDKDIASELADHGVSVVGLNLKSYLGKERTPDETATDVGRVIRAYRQRWNRSKIIIVGFSRGANVAPFALARFPEELRSSVSLVALIGLANAVNFKWHLQDVFRDVKRANDLPVRPEIDRIRSMRILCIYGADEKESACRDMPPEVTRIERPGGHHMDGNYKAVGDLVVDALKG